MKSWLIILSLFSFSAFARDITQKTNLPEYVIEIKTTVEHWGIGESQIDLFLAYFLSNEYQNCSQSAVDIHAEITHLGESGDSCLYYNIPLGRKKQFGKKIILINKFTLETADISTDFDKITTFYPYDKCNPNYTQFTGSNHPFINVEQAQLFKVSQSIWQVSKDPIDYAKNCYLFVAENFKYGEAESGFKSLEYTLANKSGDCGNLSSVYITLLRMQDIPARHLMGFRPDGSLHVWADFYLQDYGWIPVDVTYKHDYPEGNYFGNIKFEHNGFIVQRGIGHEISVLNNPKRIAGLQTYTYQVSYTKADRAKVYVDRKVSCTRK